jgi:class 3 adenylate cyclase
MEQMDSIVRERQPISLFAWFKQVWNSIINLGITRSMPLWERKRTRLLNGVCTMGVIAQAGFVLSYTAPEYRVVFWESLQAAVFYMIPIVLNYFRKHNLACHIFCIYNLLCFTYFAISHGQVDGAEYFLLPSGMSAMLFFRNIRVIISYFLANLAFFWLCKYSFTVMKPFIVLPNNENTYVPNLTILFLITFLIVHYFRTENLRQEQLLEMKNLKLSEEKQKSDRLLLNILPYETAEELKETGFAKARAFKMVTVLFTDFVNFTGIASGLSPEQVVALIHEYFSDFDTIVSKYRIEKIKTIGDSYMCAGGLPEENTSNPADVVRAALEIRQYMERLKQEKINRNEPYFELRIGVHTGPVVAGIVGTKKFAYDIWGDTVNMASRMESAGQADKINISEATYLYVKDQFRCTPRGKVAIKNKEAVEMFFVEEEWS